MRIATTFAILVSSLAAAGCADSLDSPDVLPQGSTVGGQDTTFDHDNTTISPWDLIDRITQEGPPHYTSHVHSCSKVRYGALGNVLKSVGINPANNTTNALAAGSLYSGGANALGAANYPNRIRENIALTTSGASREFDIFAAGANEVITAIQAGSLARCPGVTLFNADNTCRPEGITCLIGTPATTGHLDYCNLTVTSGSSIAVGKQLAVAAMLAAAYTCE